MYVSSVVMRCLLFPVRGLMFAAFVVARCLSRVVCCVLIVVRCSLFVVCCQLLVWCFLIVYGPGLLFVCAYGAVFVVRGCSLVYVRCLLFVA